MSTAKQVISVSTGTMLRAVVIIFAIYFVYILRDVVGILLVSALLAAVIDPLADFFARRRVPRSLTVIVTYVILFLLAAVILFAIIPPMIVELQGIGESFRSVWNKVVSSFDSLKTLSSRYGLESSFQLSIDSLNASFTQSFNNLFSTITGFLGGMVSFFIMLAITYFMVVEKNSLRDLTVALVPVRYHEYVASILAKVQRKVGQWVIGQLILAVFIGLLTYIGLAAFGVKYAVLLAVLAGFLEVLPYFGPVIATIPAAFFAFADSPTKAILVVIYYILVQRIENMILVPKIMQKTTGLNPIFVILALTVGYTVGGIAGVLLSVPVAAAANVVLEDYMERQNKAVAI
jgi:predicted PurR-regulated permease PerM